MISLEISICNSPEEAVQKGHVYHHGFTALTLKSAVVVQNGTVAGNSTVDLVFEDSSGNKYVAMTTMNLLKSIPG